jgi:HAD superfamily hydrolase (TIGR01509 family)
MPILGVIFDLDQTLVSSDLDYDAIRRDLGLGADQLILETVSAMPPGSERDDAYAVLHRHEHAGAMRSELMPGARAFLDWLSDSDIKAGVLTRNSRFATRLVIENLDLALNPALTREDVPPKPHPEGLLQICAAWNLSVSNVLFFGDFLFDLQAADNAGMRSVLYCPNDRPTWANQADFVLTDFADAIEIINIASWNRK